MEKPLVRLTETQSVGNEWDSVSPGPGHVKRKIKEYYEQLYPQTFISYTKWMNSMKDTKHWSSHRRNKPSGQSSLWVELCPPKDRLKCKALVPMNVISLGNRFYFFCKSDRVKMKSLDSALIDYGRYPNKRKRNWLQTEEWESQEKKQIRKEHSHGVLPDPWKTWA
jgi:hypothetical protein